MAGIVLSISNSGTNYYIRASLSVVAVPPSHSLSFLLESVGQEAYESHLICII